MKNYILSILIALIHAFSGVEAQTSVQTFGNGVASHTTGASTSFIPNPTGSGTTYARIGTGGGLLSLEPAIVAPPFGSGSIIRGSAATAASVNKISPMVSYTGSTQFYTKFEMLLGNSAGGNAGAVDGAWHFFQGEGSTYSDANTFDGTQVFTGLQCVFNAGGTATVNFRNGAVWTPLGAINQGTKYTIEIVGNNSAGTINYTYGVAQSVAPNTFDLFLNGVLSGNNLGKAQLPNAANISSIMFYGINSTSNAANVFLDNVKVFNAIPPVICGNVAVTANVSPGTSVCTGQSITLTGSGASTYTWTDGINTPLNGVPYTPGASATYTVTGTDGNGCTGTSTLAVTVNPTPGTPTITPGGPTTFCDGGSVTLTSSAASGNFWSPGGQTTQSITVSASGTYSVVRTVGGCTSAPSAPESVTVNPTPGTPTITPGGPTTFCDGGSVTLTSSAASGNFWSPGGQTTQSITVSTSGNYSVVSILGGCASAPSSPITVTVNPIPATPTITPGGLTTFCAGGSVTLTSSAASGNFWSPGGQTTQSITVSTSGNYSVTYSVSGCASAPSSFILVTVNSLPSVTATANPPLICAGASITLTGSGAFSYTWTDGVNTPLNGVPFIPGATATYTVTGTDGTCAGTSSVTVIVDPLPTVSASASPASICSGSGSTLNGGGAVFYHWNPGNIPGNPITVSPTTTTTYTVTGTTANGCSATSTVTLPVISSPTVTAVATQPTICSGNSTNLAGSGGDTYVWQPGNIPGNPISVSPTTTTTYTVTGFMNGCTSTAQVTVTVLITPTVSASASPASICSGSSSTLSGGGAVFYYWNPGNMPGNPITVSPTTTTTYTVIGTANGCSATSTVTLPVISTPTVTAVATQPTICSGNSTNLAGSGGDTYVWQPGNIPGNPIQVSPTTTTTYTVTGFMNGCTSTAQVTVTVLITPTVSASASPASICSGSSSTLNGGGAVFYYWNPGNMPGNPITVSPTTTTTYTVIGTANGCSNTTTVEVIVNNLPVITANPTTQTVCENAMATLAGGGGMSYLWTGGISDNTPFVVTAPDTYTVTGTDGNGCTNSATAIVMMNNTPVVTAGTTPSTTCINTSVTPIGGGAQSYTWSGGLTNGSSFIATATNTYTVTGTDGNGCSGTSSVTVTVNPSSGILAPGTSNQSQSHGDDFDIDYYDASCDLIATIDDGNGGNVLGVTTTTVNVDPTADFHNGQPYIRRWYQITPTSNGSADVVLYINQSDFNDYNSVVLPPYLQLPTTGSNSDPNIPNIRITKNDDTGLGNNPVVITPAVNWNGTYWELSFNTPSFSQFRVHGVNPGNVPLPVVLTAFDGKKMESTDELTWTTGSEQNNAYFNLQHSTDGINFETIAKVNSKAINGNSATPLNYNAINSHPASGHNYYRLQQVDIDNKASIHAKIVDLIWGANGSTVNIYPNPTRDILNIDLYTTKVQNTTVKVLDMSSRTIKQVQAKSVAGMNNITISLAAFASGLYTVQVYENDQLMQTGKVRKND